MARSSNFWHHQCWSVDNKLYRSLLRGFTKSCVYDKENEDFDCCTCSFYRAFLISTSLGLIGTFAAGFLQVFVAGQFVNDINPNGADDTTSTDTFNALGLVSATANFLATLVAIISMILVAFIVNQNPWRKCGRDAHCTNACLLYMVLLITVSIAFFLIVEGNYLEVLTNKSANCASENNSLLFLLVSFWFFFLSVAVLVFQF